MHSKVAPLYSVHCIRSAGATATLHVQLDRSVAVSAPPLFFHRSPPRLCPYLSEQRFVGAEARTPPKASSKWFFAELLRRRKIPTVPAHSLQQTTWNIRGILTWSLSFLLWTVALFYTPTGDLKLQKTGTSLASKLALRSTSVLFYQYLCCLS